MRKSRFLLLPLLFVLAVPAVAGEDSGSESVPSDAPVRAYPDNLLVDTLPNGLQVVVEERHRAPIVHVRALMRIGSIYEGEYLGCGLSHYMEHIVSGGSTRREVEGEDGSARTVGRTEAENKQLLQSIGGDSNASTSFDYTNFYITTKSEMAETAVDLISDYLQHCQFDPVEVEREQRVVQQELLRNLDNPARFRNELFTETMFKEHPARVPVVGYIDAIDTVTRDDMLRFYHEHYTPQNCVVAIVGDVDKHAMLDLVRKYFGAWKRKPLAPYVIPQEPEQTSMRWVEKPHGATTTCLVSMGVPSIPLRHPDLCALDMLSHVLGLGASSRLPQKFEHDPTRRVIATQVGCYDWTPVFGAGRFAWSFSTDTVEHARQLVWEIWNESTRLKEDLVSPEEIDRCLKQIEKYHWQSHASFEDRAQTLASNLAWLHDPLYTDAYLEKIRTVTPEQIREMARKYLVRDRLDVVIVTPPQTKKAVASEKETEAEGRVHKVVLDNGLTLLVKRVPDYGMVDVAAAFNGGVIYENEKTNGLFFLMANTFWRGTESRPFRSLVQQMDDLGMDLSSESHNNVWYVKMKSLSADFEPSMDVFADVILHPAISDQWVAQVKGLLLGRVLPNLAVDPEEMVQRVLRQTLYTKSPYRMQRFGTPETVGSFTPDDVRSLYRTFARPNNCVLAVYGDLDPDATIALLKEKFGAWERGEIPPSGAVADDPGLEAPKAVVLENQQVRTNYRMAWRAYPRQAEAERAAVAVMNGIIGARGWLYERLREGDANYVYAVYSAPYAGDKVGHFYVNTDFSPEDEGVVVAIIDSVIADIQAGKFTDDELELSRKMILCYEALQKQENANIVAGDALNELYGDGYDQDEAFFRQIRAVGREDIVRVAREIFSGPALRILVRPKVGD